MMDPHAPLMHHPETEPDVMRWDARTKLAFINAMLDIDTPLAWITRVYVAYILQEFLFPSSPKERKKTYKALKAAALQATIERSAEKFKEQGKRNSVASAYDEVAESFGVNAETLKKRILRGQQAFRRKKNRKSLKPVTSGPMRFPPPMS